MAATVEIKQKGSIKTRVDGSRHATVEYCVKSDSLTENMNNLLSVSGVPQRFVDSHPDNSFMICVGSEIDKWENSKYIYIVTATFDSATNFDAIDHNIGQGIVEGGLRGIIEMVPAFADAVGNPVVNDADEYYEGLMKRKRLIGVPTTGHYATIPWDIFSEYHGTVNANEVTIHGKTFPPGTVLLDAPNMPKRPTRLANGDYAWSVDYEFIINADGWVSVLPNRGYKAWQYQTRTEDDAGPPRTFTKWEDVDFADYDTETDSDLKRKIKVRILDDSEAEVPENVWLDNHGQAITGSLTVKTGTGAITDASFSMTGTSLTSDDIGKHIVVTGGGFDGRDLKTRIENVSGGTVTLQVAARATDATASFRVGGAWVKTYQLEDLATWTGVLFPNNQTT